MTRRGQLALILTVLGALAFASERAQALVEPLRLSPGDSLGVQVVGYKDLDDGYEVDVQGDVSLALAGDLHVAGLTAAEAESLLTQEYWKHLLTQPQVLVRDRHRVSVLGEVMRPGIYHVSGTERITDLLARAGGTTQQARLKGVRLSRNGEVLKRDVRRSLSQGETLADVGFQSGDILYVPRGRSFFDLRIWTTFISAAYVTLSLLDRIQNK